MWNERRRFSVEWTLGPTLRSSERFEPTHPSNPRSTMSAETCGSVTLMIRGLRGGDEAKVTPLWGRYFERLTHVAAKHLRFAPTGSRGTEEDAALSAINSFCDGLAAGKFEYVDRREVLWGTLAKITERKALRQLRDRRWEKEVVFTDLQPDVSMAGDGSRRLAIVEPTREYTDVVRLELDDLIDALENPLWREAVRMVLEGDSVPEIAAKLHRSRECVYIWFRTIRQIWEERSGSGNLLG